MKNLFPEFGNIILSNTNNNKQTLVYLIDFPKYISSKYDVKEYNEEYENFKDRIVEVFKKRLKHNNKRLRNITFDKILPKHPSSIGIIKENYSYIKKYFREKTKNEMIKDYGNQYYETVNNKDYYIPKKYKDICITVDVKEEK